MKKAAVVLAVVVMVVSLVSLGFAGDSMKGTIKSVDAKAGKVVITTDGGDKTMSVDKGVDLGTVKDGDKVEFTAENDMVKSMKAEALAKKKRPAMGC